MKKVTVTLNDDDLDAVQATADLWGMTEEEWVQEAVRKLARFGRSGRIYRSFESRETAEGFIERLREVLLEGFGPKAEIPDSKLWDLTRPGE